MTVKERTQRCLAGCCLSAASPKSVGLCLVFVVVLSVVGWIGHIQTNGFPAMKPPPLANHIKHCANAGVATVALADLTLVVSAYDEDPSYLTRVVGAADIHIMAHNRSQSGLRGGGRYSRDIDDMKHNEYTALADQFENVHVQVIPNFGNEGAAYLTFIIEHYERLPTWTAFSHMEEKPWHGPQDMPDLLHNLCFPPDWKYASLSSPTDPIRNDVLGSPPQHWLICATADPSWLGSITATFKHNMAQPMRRRRRWEEISEVLDPLRQSDPSIPNRWLIHNYAQFVVHRDAILRHPVSVYKTLREALRTRELRGIMMEKLWPALLYNGNQDSIGKEEEERIKRQLC